MTYEVTVSVEALREDADLDWDDREANDSPVGDHQFFIDSDHPSDGRKRRSKEGLGNRKPNSEANGFRSEAKLPTSGFPVLIRHL